MMGLICFSPRLTSKEAAAPPCTGDTRATAIGKHLGEGETGRKLLPNLLSEQHLPSHLLWCPGGQALRTDVQEPQTCLALVRRSQAKSRGDSQQTRLPNSHQLEKSGRSGPPVAHTLHLPKNYACMWCEMLPFWFRDSKQGAHREVSTVRLKSGVCSELHCSSPLNRSHLLCCTQSSLHWKDT